MTNDRVIADKLYQALEGLLFIAVKNMHDAPRREDNRLAFIEAVEALMFEVRK